MKKNKTIMLMTLGCVMCLSITAYAYINTDSKESILNKTPITAPTQESEIPDGTEAPGVVKFKGKIASIDGDEAIVMPDEGEDIRSSGDAICINIADYSKPLNAGDTVTIYYDGIIMESYPLQINLLGINDEMFHIKEPGNGEDLDEGVTFDNAEVLE
ncbi:hypothetical protein RZO55_14315 [Clostridium boliviensis]|uniref:DUF5666 domain-containing protein n=1 Tax=Clostridium boliviensis TaxID=318465 RepID=A0ABU4GMA3_9CLOT|nr:hypothetical protein [Clostridium boliviensis]MDW2798753.1 hypothetical protein [Clostridium boliviensis]